MAVLSQASLVGSSLKRFYKTLACVMHSARAAIEHRSISELSRVSGRKLACVICRRLGKQFEFVMHRARAAIHAGGGREIVGAYLGRKVTHVCCAPGSAATWLPTGKNGNVNRKVKV